VKGLVIEVVAIPVEFMLRKIIHDAVMEQLGYLCSELEAIDPDLAESCSGDVDCKLDMLKIAYETTVIILRELLEKSFEDEWKDILDVYHNVKNSIYIT